jgi:hypothetical protein
MELEYILRAVQGRLPNTFEILNLVRGKLVKTGSFKQTLTLTAQTYFLGEVTSLDLYTPVEI